ncbi:MAG: AAA family ATPase, partial [Thermoplasmata archaeon]
MVSMAQSGTAFTFEKRILLHLLKYTSLKNEFENPPEVSQYGIAESLNCRQSDVSRMLKKMLHEGFIECITTHIKGAKQRRKVYFLTPKGREVALQLLEDLRQSLVVVKHPQSGSVEMKMEDVLKLLNHKYDIIHLFFIYSNYGHIAVTESGEVNIDEDKPLLSKTPVQPLTSPAADKDVDKRIKQAERHAEDVDAGERVPVKFKLPHPGRLFGRHEERKAISDFLSDSELSVLLIYGLAGMGKTTLASTHLHSSPEDTFWFTLRPYTTINNFTTEIASFFLQFEIPDLVNFQEPGQAVDIISLVSTISELFSRQEFALQGTPGSKPVMVLDDIQKASAEMKELIEELIDVCRTRRTFKLVLLSRQMPPYIDQRLTVLSGQVKILELKGLDFASARRILNIPGLSEQELRAAWELLSGHPLSLELLAKSSSQTPTALTLPEKGDAVALKDAPFLHIQLFISNQIMSTLSQQDREILEFTSVLRLPFNRLAMEQITGFSFDSFENLIHNG